LLTKLDNHVSVIDTYALGRPNVVAAYLVTGKEKALIDMGYQSSAALVIRDVEKSGSAVDGLDYLLPTHVHLDHSGSCGTLAESFVGASIRVHPKGEPHLVDPTKLWKGATELFGDELMQRFGMPQPIEKSRLRVIADDAEIVLGSGLTLRSLWTPGHASHHLSYELEGTGIVLTGDAVGIRYPEFPVLIPTTPPTSFNFKLTVESLERIRRIKPTKLLTPHFGLMTNAADLIDHNLEVLREWKARIEGMVRNGNSQDEITRTLTEKTAQRAGMPVTGIPDYLSVSIRTSVLGFLRYLKASN